MRPTIFVSSSVYGRKDLLAQIFAVLTGYEYDVWMSCKGTVPIDPTLSNFENCVAAVEKCDVFLGIIFGRYGSGVQPGEVSITHSEVRRSVEVDKLRFFAVLGDVVTARTLLKQFRFNADGSKKESTFFQPTPILDDIRVIEMYEDAVRIDVSLSHRTGGWVQPFDTDADLLLFLRSQFADVNRIRRLLAEEEDE